MAFADCVEVVVGTLGATPYSLVLTSETAVENLGVPHPAAHLSVSLSLSVLSSLELC